MLFDSVAKQILRRGGSQCGRNEATCNCPIDHGGRDRERASNGSPHGEGCRADQCGSKLLRQPLGWLSPSISDCPLSYAGFTLYGTLDVGYGYDTAGVPFGNSYTRGSTTASRGRAEAAGGPGRRML